MGLAKGDESLDFFPGEQLDNAARPGYHSEIYSPELIDHSLLSVSFVQLLSGLLLFDMRVEYVLLELQHSHGY